MRSRSAPLITIRPGAAPGGAGRDDGALRAALPADLPGSPTISPARSSRSATPPTSSPTRDRPAGMPPVCLFSPMNHPPRRDFIKHLPYALSDSASSARARRPIPSGSARPAGRSRPAPAGPDRNQAILFGYAFAPVAGAMQPPASISRASRCPGQRADRQPEYTELGRPGPIPRGPGTRSAGSIRRRCRNAS